MTEPPNLETLTLAPHTPDESEIFTTLNHLVSRIDADDRVDEIVKKAADLDVDDKQLLVDCLSMALDKEAAPPNTRPYVWRSLIKVATSVKVFARSHILNIDSATRLGNLPNSPILSVKLGSVSAHLKVLKQAKKGDDELYTESLVAWVHLSHPNVLSLYAMFLENEGHHLYLATPSTIEIKICQYLESRPEASRMELIADVACGLSYLHRYGIVHGELHPEVVLISGEGRAIITNLDHAEGRGTDSVPIRYIPPEFLEHDDSKVSKASDVWMFSCLSYEVLSGDSPFSEISREVRVASAISTGKKPVRPGQATSKGISISDAVWQLLLMCWELNPADRPPCLSIYQIILNLGIRDTRPVSTPTLLSGSRNVFLPDVETMKAQLTQIVGSENSPSLMVPEQLGQSLETLVSNRDKLNATVAIAKGLSPEDTQMFVDFLELVVADLGPYRNANLAYYLLVSIMKSSHVVPGFYKLSSGIRYDPTPLLVNGSLTSVHRGSDLKVLVHIAAPAMFRKDLFVNLPCWAYISDSNVLSFYGLFYEDAPESPRLCVVTPLWASHTLNDYIAEASQTSRMPLVLDIASGMIYLQKMNTVTQYETKGNILVSDQGRAVITCDFPVNLRLPRQSTYFRRFSAPFHRYDWVDNVWTFGCLCYMILTCKEPYYQYTEEADIESAVHRGELPRRPNGNEDDMDEIGDCAWSLINHCCQYWRRYRPTLEEAQRSVISWGIKDDRPSVDMSLETSLFVMRSRPFVNFNRVETLLGQIQIELLKSPLTKLLRNNMKDLVRATEGLKPDDIRALVDFLDLVLTDYLLKSEERNCALALLAKVTSTTHIFPRRYELKAIRYHPRPIAEGGYGAVHRGVDVDVCVKVMSQVDPKALTPWFRELILWAHLSHPNILPFCGVLLDKVNGSQRICLVSPFMRNGNLNTYARRLSPRSRLALVITILDVANGLQHLHEFGIIHGDLKGENVLISNEGRCLITDFGNEMSGHLDVFVMRSIVQISVALARKEIPKRPGLAQNDAENGVNEDTLDFDEEAEECDEIDDQAWNLITTCCEPEPGSRPGISTIRQLIVDMKVWDDRPAPKTSFATEISKLREDQVISPDHIGELLSDLQKAVVSIDEEDLEEDIDFQDLWYSVVDS
ncbi:hypothetical protein NP233_g4376 [Leucocoprinus birnbaumii]|uniref:Protein kinase domain-containing protein n=1 Tax=Leucocoprinus birnbaumii TaxID=56174 RepID=A0AAD5VXI2_9AGAR|nr:hypothetical protein NP233_g4376 [Leucocoprinus birnbaumii]